MRFRLVAVSVTATLVTSLLAVVFVAAFFSGRAIGTVQELLVPTVRMVAIQLDERIREVERVTFMSIAGSPILEPLMSSDRRNRLSPTDLIRMSQALQPAAHPWVTGIYLIAADGTALYHEGSPSLKVGFDIKKEPWWDSFLQTDQAPFLVPAGLPDRFVLAMREPIVSIVSTVRGYRGDLSPAHIIVDVRAQRLFEMLGEADEWEMQSPFVLHSAGLVQYAGSDYARAIAETLSDNTDWWAAVYERPGNTGNIRVSESGEDFIVVYAVAPYTGWVVGNVVSSTDILKFARGVWGAAAMVAGITIVAGVLFARFATTAVFRPVELFREHIDTIDDVSNIVLFRRETTDELGALVDTFNKMATRIAHSVHEVNRLNERAAETLERKRRAELLALQTQISPHFLHNTLESIATTAELNGDMEAREMAVSLSRLLRSGLADPRATVTVADELANVSHYLTIEKIRFDDRLQYAVTCSDLVQDAQTLRLVVQPVVENIFRHSLDGSSNATTVSVTAYANDENLVFEVRQIGPGLTAEDFTRLRQTIRAGSESALAREHGIGLANVNERITLTYENEKWGVFVQTTDPVDGLTVQIRQPLILPTLDI